MAILAMPRHRQECVCYAAAQALAHSLALRGEFPRILVCVPLRGDPEEAEGDPTIRRPSIPQEDSVRHYAAALCLTLFWIFAIVPAARGQQATLDGLLDREMPSLLSTYKSLHAAPELSHHEEKTSAFVAGELRALGYTVTEHVGKYAGHPEWVSYGVVGVLKNGDGPTVYVRTELDALPVEEMTGTALRQQSPDEG